MDDTTVLLRARLAWGEETIKEPADLLVIWPIGSRPDALIYWRAGKQVTTGFTSGRPCFVGDLDHFETKLEADYSGRRERLPHVEEGVFEHTRAILFRNWNDYRAAVQFLRSIGC